VSACSEGFRCEQVESRAQFMSNAGPYVVVARKQPRRESVAHRLRAPAQRVTRPLNSEKFDFSEFGRIEVSQAQTSSLPPQPAAKSI